MVNWHGKTGQVAVLERLIRRAVLAAFTRRYRQIEEKKEFGRKTTAVGGGLSSSNADDLGENSGEEWGRASSSHSLRIIQ